MWLATNMVLLIISIALMAYGKYIDSSENTEALMFFLGGIVLLVVTVISGIIELIARWV